jgi:hypothetical protein
LAVPAAPVEEAAVVDEEAEAEAEVVVDAAGAVAAVDLPVGAAGVADVAPSTGNSLLSATGADVTSPSRRIPAR